MGYGFGFTCSKCGEQYCATCGVGFEFPQVYQELLKDIKNGKYGAEWQKLALSDETVAVDAERYLYVCSKCGCWAVESGHSLYVANDMDVAQKSREKRNWTVSRAAAFVAPIELKEDYHLLKRRVHKCSGCGSRMHKATDIEAYNLKCPHCGSVPDENTVRSEIMWD